MRAFLEELRATFSKLKYVLGWRLVNTLNLSQYLTFSISVVNELTRFTQKRRKNQRQRNRDCKIELEGIQLEVAEDDKELLLLPAMEGNGLEDVFTELDGAWGVPENKKTTLSTRTNQLPD